MKEKKTRKNKNDGSEPEKLETAIHHLPNATNVEFNSTHVEQSYYTNSFKIVQSKISTLQIVLWKLNPSTVYDRNKLCISRIPWICCEECNGI